MEVFVPLLILAVVVVVLAYRHNSHAKAIVDAHADTLKSVVTSLTAAPAAPALQIAPAVLQHPAVTMGAVTAATAAVLPKAALDLIAGFADNSAQLAAAKANSPQAAGFAVVAYPGRPLQPADYQGLNATTVIADGNGFYLDNTGNVCHFENGAKVMGYATAAAHA